MSEKKPDSKVKLENHPFFEDESDEPTIVWVKPPRRLRGFTKRVHFLTQLPTPQTDSDDQPSEEQTVDETPTERDGEGDGADQGAPFEEDTRV